MKKLIMTTFCTLTIIAVFYAAWTDESFVTLTQSVDVDQNELERYLTAEVMSPNFGGDVYASYHILGTSTTRQEVYVWALLQEYYPNHQQLERGTGMSVPIVLRIDQSTGVSRIVDHTLPRDGSYYPSDLHTLFPLRISIGIMYYPTELVNRLHQQLEHKLPLPVSTTY
ncbi:hypothetical protein ACQKD4_01490 [Exiguobacterium sp. NPDC077395]|uniref:hypothetical protein n=1 Tax=Exiguobacterium sp. NPDC077395 TaxID=3390563 RepID=UPI003D091D65